MKTLDLVLTYKRFDLIKTFEKKEEYREINDYWISRICKVVQNWPKNHKLKSCDFGRNCLLSHCLSDVPTYINQIRFHKGYTNTTLLRNVDFIEIGYGRPEWGAPPHKVFIFHLLPPSPTLVQGGGK